jgi:preprotein translocase subunit Sec61beta
MSKKEKIVMPPTGGGLFRTYSEEGTGLKLKPEHIIFISIGIIAFEVFLHIYGRALF